MDNKDSEFINFLCYIGSLRVIYHLFCSIQQYLQTCGFRCTTCNKSRTT